MRQQEVVHFAVKWFGEHRSVVVKAARHTECLIGWESLWWVRRKSSSARAHGAGFDFLPRRNKGVLATVEVTVAVDSSERPAYAVETMFLLIS